MVSVRAARPTTPAQAGLSPADFLRIIRHKLLLIVVLWVVSIGLTVGITALMIKYYPKYASQAYVQVESLNPINVLNPLQNEMVSQEEITRLVLNQCVMVKSPEVLTRALEDAELRRTRWFAEAQEKERLHNEDPMDLLNDIIYASPIRDSNFFSVSASWEVPEELPILVNTVVQKYTDKIEEQQKAGIRKADDQLGKELARASTLFEDIRQKIESLRANEDVLAGGIEGPSERLLTLQALVTELEVEMLGRKTQWEALQGARPEDLPITADLQALLDQDPTLYQMEVRRQTAVESLNVAAERFGPNHRVVREVKVALESVEARLAEERAVRVVKYQNEQIEQARRSFLEAQDQLLSLKESLEAAKAEQRDKDAKYARYMRLLEERDLRKKDYEGLLEQKNLISITLRSEKSVKIDVRSWAIPPKRRSSPQWSLWLPAGAMLGLVLSFGLAFLLELADTSVRTPRDVQSVSVLGTIPTSDDDEIKIERVETACIDAPHSIFAEAFRNLRANLFFSAPAEQQGVVLITSPSGGNGKTTVATNLAISVALSGRRVLLIDANFRRASLPRIFPDMRPEGLSNILIGQSRLADLAAPTSVPGLDVLGAGPAPPNPAELLGGSYLRDVVVDARSQYDQVIFDGPPLLLVSDALVLAGAVDGVLVVCQYRATSRGALQRSLAQLETINARVFGAILNLVETRAGGYFRKAYREFYEYQEPEEEGGPTRPRLEVHAGEGRLQATSAVSPEGPGGAATEGDESPAEAFKGDPRRAPFDGRTTASDDVAAREVAGLAVTGGTDVGRDLGLGLDDARGPDVLASAIPELDREIENLKGEEVLPADLGMEDEFKLEDLDFGIDLPGPDKDEPEEGDKPRG
jgi:capsular exopolysaccharide synthesis family protein